MRCPFCNHDNTTVIDSRVSEAGDAVRRRRRCEACDRRFTTYERSELALPAVVKKNGSREDYDSSKVRDSMRLALRKRPVPAEAVDEAIARIEEKLIASPEREIGSDRVGELVMRELKRLDKIAYIRFASVYKSFEDVSEFTDMLQELAPRNRRGK
ncbi:MAG: transcriptional regulator NrdR [Candidatus Protistobacter heckmanni]|nr:transcriptional regulator NrdR [Candidatus Protistobacter heckmanni]